MLNCRIWPNGEFSVWEEKKTLAVEGPPPQPDYLGLSLLANSHRVALGCAEPPPVRARRGERGITRLGARTVRNGAFLLEEARQPKHLSFLTFTLPSVGEVAEYEAGREWSEILRIFLQSIVRLLKAAGLPPTYVGCTEIQEGRWARHGGLPLHLHLVITGRKPGGHWAISSDQFRALWRRAVVGRCPSFSEASFAAAVDTQRVRSSAAGYLGKYMSKGPGAIARMLAKDPGLSGLLPSTWWCCSANLRRAIGRRIAGGVGSALTLMRDVRSSSTRIAYSREIIVELNDGSPLRVAVIGNLSPEGRLKYCHPWHLDKDPNTVERRGAPIMRIDTH